MSLYLPDQKLGSHSGEGGSSNKFMLKGRQTGTMHRGGHSWVFRAESYDTMMAWYEDIKALIEKSPMERTAFVRQHARSFSGTSQRAGSISSDGVMDEEDEEPFSTSPSGFVGTEPKEKRPQPGGRFPSDLQVNSQRGSQVAFSPSSGSDDGGMIGGTSNTSQRQAGYGISSPVDSGEMEPNRATQLAQYAQEDGVNPYTYQQLPLATENTDYAVAGAGGAAAGIVGTEAYHQQQEMAAANESAQISAPDTAYDSKALEHRQLAAEESSQIAMNDTDHVHPVFRPAYDNQGPFVSGAGPSNEQEISATAAPETKDAETAEAGKVATGALPDPANTPSRPQAINADTFTSISGLHIPGEYPKDKKNITTS